MFNRKCLNSRLDGFAVLEIRGEKDPERRFVPLMRSDLSGQVTGPLAYLRLAQTFSFPARPDRQPLEALYRFPLPGDAAVTGVCVRFGEVEIRTALKERATAEGEYTEAKEKGQQAVLLTRESPDVFTLAVAGIVPGQDVRVETEYVQLATREGDHWSLRIPLTTAPRFTRPDEAGSRHADGQPLAVARDPGHRFALDLAVRGAAKVESATHPLETGREQDGVRVRLRDGEVIPDRDCVITWRPDANAGANAGQPTLEVRIQAEAASNRAYFLAFCAAPTLEKKQRGAAREVVLLVDHSGSMKGPKWAAADWAVERFLAGLTERDAFALGVFHNDTRWLAPEPMKATAEAVGRAVQFLKANRTEGGTNLGVALEQALDLPRRADTPSRHVLILTDAEVTDSGRLLLLADREAAREAAAEATRADRRRVSLLCIDAAPNATLASELAERGGGIAHFLTSNPEENDITTALDEVLADWAAPVWTALALEVNRPGAEAAGRSVSLRVPGPAAAIDVGDVPAGRPVWVAGRLALDGGPLTFQLRAAGTDVLAECKVSQSESVPGLKALFGAQRVRRLEYLMYSGQNAEEIRTELHRLGYDANALAPGAKAKVYAENDRKSATDLVRTLLVREALESGLPSAETAFVAVRTEAGRPVAGTVVVANAVPAGWGSEFLHAPLASGMLPPARGLQGGASRFLRSRILPGFMSSNPGKPEMQAKAAAPQDYRGEFDAADDFDREEDSLRGVSGGKETRISISADKHPVGAGAVLYDSARNKGKKALASTGRLTALTLAIAEPTVTADAIGANLKLLVFVGNAAEPRARVALADVLRAGGRRPLNVRWKSGEGVRLTIEDPDGRWQNGVPAMEITLAWEG